MKDNPQLRNIIVAIVIILIFTVSYIVIDKLTTKDKNEYEDFLKNYEVNEFIPTYVSDEDMAKIYLNDYIHIMYSDIQKAYNLLNEEYRIKKFGNLTNFENYVNSLTYSSYQLDSFYIDSSEEYKIFGVYDTNGNIFIFKTKGVMQYTVYLDDYTVEI